MLQMWLIFNWNIPDFCRGRSNHKRQGIAVDRWALLSASHSAVEQFLEVDADRRRSSPGILAC